MNNHLLHHIYMNQKYRIALSLDMILIILGILYGLLYLAIKEYGGYLVAGLIQGLTIYDMMHYSFHHFRFTLPLRCIDQWY